MSDHYVKCRVCGCAMNARVAEDHIRVHMEAGDLIRAAHRLETEELGALLTDDDVTA